MSRPNLSDTVKHDGGRCLCSSTYASNSAFSFDISIGTSIFCFACVCANVIVKARLYVLYQDKSTQWTFEG